MTSFRKEILQQIEQIDVGRIFTFRDLSFPNDKLVFGAVFVSVQCNIGFLLGVVFGAFFRRCFWGLGCGCFWVYQDEQFRYITQKLDGYITGAYIYNKMGLTEQVATTITVATLNPVRRFRFKNLDVECVKSYTAAYHDETNIPYLRLLDAVKDIKHIPGSTQKDIYERIKNQYFNSFSIQELIKVVSLAKDYPPRVRKIVADILGEMGQYDLQRKIANTVLPTTRFNLNYKTT